MNIVTDVLIISLLISVSVTLWYLHLVVRHLNSLPYFIKNLNKYNLLSYVMSKIAECVAASHLSLHCLLRPV